MNSKFLHTKYLAVLLLGFIILLLVAFDAFSAEVNIGGNGAIVLKASESITRPETRYEDYEDTCSESVYNGTHTVCSGGVSETRCRKVAGVGEECWQETTGESCSEEPSYSTHYYSCTRTRAYTVNVHDHYVDATVFVNKTESANNFDLNKCGLGIKLNNVAESFYALCQEAVVRADVKERKESVDGLGNKSRDIKVDLSFTSIEDFSAMKAGFRNLDFKNGRASFTSANLIVATNYKLTATLTRNRFLLKDKVLFNRDLKASELKVEAQADGTFKVSFDLAKLSGFDSSKKHTLKLDLKTIKAGDVKGTINEPTLANSLSQTIIINE